MNKQEAATVEAPVEGAAEESMMPAAFGPEVERRARREKERPPMTPAERRPRGPTFDERQRMKVAPGRLPVRVRVTFEEPAEFVEEVEEAADHVEGGVVRFIVRYDPPGEAAGIRHVELVAGAVVAGEILELVAKAGAVWGDDGDGDQATKKRVDTWHAQLVELCGRKGLALKGGRFGAV